MFKNYLSVALRSFMRNKVFTLINISGLAIGISASLVIFLIVQYEFSYENFLKNKDRMYRVVTSLHFPDMLIHNGGAPGPLHTAVEESIPGIENSTAFWMNYQMDVEISDGNNKSETFKKQKNILYADEGYFQMIPYTWISGDPGDALNGPNQVVLTESRARAYFPYQDITRAVGRTITYNDSIQAVVTGIVEDLKEVSGFNFSEFISLATFLDDWKKNQSGDEWGSVTSSSQFFVLLEPGVTPERINEQLAELRKQHASENDVPTEYTLQPVGDIHFNTDYDSLSAPHGHKPTLYGLLVVAAFLLLLGCINFINLTTAQSSQRAKEIGVRKTLGSSVGQMRVQFLSETFILAMIASILSLSITPLILRMFSGFIPEGLHFSLRQHPMILLVVTGLIVIVGLLAGFYPAMVLSKLKAVLAIKNTVADTASNRGALVRKSLIVSQFVIAQFFIIATLIVGKQIRYSLTKDMGFKRDAIFSFRAPYNYFNPDNKQYVLSDRLRSIPGIEKMSLAGSPPASNSTNTTTMKFSEDGKDIETMVEVKNADTSFFNLYGIRLLAGRNLQLSDTLKEYVINEYYCHFLGYDNPQDIIGKMIKRNTKNVPIVGVVNDINTKSVARAIGPLAFANIGKNHSTFHIKLPPQGETTGAWNKTIDAIRKVFHEVYPDKEFSYTFFDDDIAAFYKKERDISQLLNWSAGLTIFISCLGLLGLVLFTTAQRVKEIGVRKVLGASVGQLVVLLSSDLLKLVLIAFFIAAPIAWWIMHRWLDNYAYRTSIGIWLFALSGLVMLLVAVITLSTQKIRSALANPAESLRSE